MPTPSFTPDNTAPAAKSAAAAAPDNTAPDAVSRASIVPDNTAPASLVTIANAPNNAEPAAIAAAAAAPDNTAPAAVSRASLVPDNTAPDALVTIANAPNNAEPAAIAAAAAAPDNTAPAASARTDVTPDNTAPASKSASAVNPDNAEPGSLSAPTNYGTSEPPQPMTFPLPPATDETVNTPVINLPGMFVLDAIMGQTRVAVASNLTRLQLQLNDAPVDEDVEVSLVDGDDEPLGITVTVPAGEKFGETVLEEPQGFLAAANIRAKVTAVGSAAYPGGNGVLTLFMQLAT